jgi:hypothetical protein
MGSEDMSCTYFKIMWMNLFKQCKVFESFNFSGKYQYNFIGVGFSSFEKLLHMFQ